MAALHASQLEAVVVLHAAELEGIRVEFRSEFDGVRQFVGMTPPPGGTSD